MSRVRKTTLFNIPYDSVNIIEKCDAMSNQCVGKYTTDFPSCTVPLRKITFVLKIAVFQTLHVLEMPFSPLKIDINSTFLKLLNFVGAKSLYPSLTGLGNFSVKLYKPLRGSDSV